MSHAYRFRQIAIASDKHRRVVRAALRQPDKVEGYEGVHALLSPLLAELKVARAFSHVDAASLECSLERVGVRGLDLLYVPESQLTPGVSAIAS